MVDLTVVARPLGVHLDPVAVCGEYAADGDVVLIGSWAGGGALIASDPVTVVAGAPDPFELFDEPIGAAATGPAVGGGWFGSLGFRAGRRPARSRLSPDSRWAFYPTVLRYDAARRQWFDEALVGSADSSTLQRRRADAVARLHRAADRVAGGVERPASVSRFTASFGRAGYEHAVETAQAHIAAGDIYQVNLCLALTTAVQGSTATLFQRLMRSLRPAFGAHLVTADGAVVSSSPELFLRRTGPHVVSSPIKGTRPRPADVARSTAEADRLRASVKDRAENVMIVDMVRNDLARVAVTGSVRVTDLLRLEPHPGVWHLVSDVTATLRPDATDAELLRACFPPGSVTGAPKLRALEVIDELEPVPRGVYTGAVGYCSPAHGLELSVAIRTLEVGNGIGRLGVGAGITASSDPSEEWWECFDKATPLVGALGASIEDEAARRPG